MVGRERPVASATAVVLLILLLAPLLIYDRLQRQDLMQASAIMASIVYHAATRDEMLPRETLRNGDRVWLS